MNKRRILGLIVGLYLCIAVSGFIIYRINNQLNNVIVYLRERFYLEDLNAGLQIMSWILFAMIVMLVIFIWEVFSTVKKLSNQNQETVESSLEVNSEETVSDQTIKKQKEIMTIYLSSGDSFFHEIDSVKFSSQEIIEKWQNMPLGGELIVEDRAGWSSYKMEEIVAITILFE
ncbi:hypothetical protein [Enterococcus faecium]|uniref:hypothetical protein n=1 Tax=Enterococcus TaxID=1350 RepID=UPI0019124531|nr:hypothetical protein [Enterococcus faecium]MBK5028872.1 hypothetical protein [Enterococcus faecium]MBK5039594.1 hypothetical protein [Enterococcus faecium]MBK5044514.1 hypothetical protein [Enterococcus faecium]MBK5069449.1 hypothetical protein [Enterococcus faecium]MBK5132677.1 hypothetical protein [Enterococcus faecium]